MVTMHMSGHKAHASAEYSGPGTYALLLPCPLSRMHATITVEMVDARHMSFVDSYSVSFHMDVHRMLKWLLVLPFVAMALASLLLDSSGKSSSSLPEYL